MFHFGDTSLRAARLEYLSDNDRNALRELIECNQRKSTRKLTLDLNTFQSTICSRLREREIIKMSKLGFGVPHTISERNKEDRISIETILFSQINHSFLKNIITGDGKWVFYANFQ